MSYFYILFLTILFSVFILKVDFGNCSDLEKSFPCYKYSLLDDHSPRLITQHVKGTSISDNDNYKFRVRPSAFFSRIAVGGLTAALMCGAIDFLMAHLHGSCKSDNLLSKVDNTVSPAFLSGFYTVDFPWSPYLAVLIPCLAVLSYFLGKLTDRLSPTNSLMLFGSIIWTVWVSLIGLTLYSSSDTFVWLRGLISGILTLSITPLIKGIFTIVNHQDRLTSYLCMGLLSAFSLTSVIISQIFKVIYKLPTVLTGNFWTIGLVYMPIAIVVLAAYAVTIASPVNLPQKYKETCKRKNLYIENQAKYTRKHALVLLGFALSLTQIQLFQDFIVPQFDLVEMSWKFIGVSAVSSLILIASAAYTVFSGNWTVFCLFGTVMAGLSYVILAFPHFYYLNIVLVSIIFSFSELSTLGFISYIIAKSNFEKLGTIFGRTIPVVAIFALMVHLMIVKMGFEPFVLQINLLITFAITIVLVVLLHIELTKTSKSLLDMESVTKEKRLLKYYN